MDDRVLRLASVTAFKAPEPYWPEEIDDAQVGSDADFAELCVLFTFRLSMGVQHTPINVWFFKTDVPESEWYAHARRIALQMVGMPEEA